ncbi:MAG: hypothetical protein QNJ14_19510 [Woeseiaceae bacterium]|nr:hypothetical protein [Woeseiaceae bacterium]
MTLQITGQLDTEGNPISWTGPIDVVRFGNTLRNKETGMVWAIQDEYGDWVSPGMHSLGLKSVMTVVEKGQ